MTLYHFFALVQFVLIGFLAINEIGTYMTARQYTVGDAFGILIFLGNIAYLFYMAGRADGAEKKRGAA